MNRKQRRQHKQSEFSELRTSKALIGEVLDVLLRAAYQAGMKTERLQEIQDDLVMAYYKGLDNGFTMGLAYEIKQLATMPADKLNIRFLKRLQESMEKMKEMVN